MNLEYKVHRFSTKKDSRTPLGKSLTRTTKKDWRTSLEKSLNQFSKKGWELDQILYEGSQKIPHTLILRKLKSKQS